MLVRELMTTDVETVERDRSLRDAVAVMLKHGIGSVVVTSDGDPTGIVTENDVLQAGYASGRPLDAIPISKAMSHPLRTVSPTTTVRKAAKKMGDDDSKKLPVADGMELVGILTLTDIVNSQADILREVRHLDNRREAWDDDGV
ncbi:CBS domain-containing protein [Halorussus halophilus]|uniref:CBS domain-containing protein n=1 Tax=Halorussus halophilus TaxID=2650975 RepID=UPI0013014E8E|nr:CBS domain-containing protein [Halorussus halophilus]